MRNFAILVFVLALLPTAAQGQRPGKKPGEVITRPDFSQGGFGEDHLEIGKPAPEFTLQWLKPPSPRSLDNEKDSSSVSRTISLTELRAKKPAVLVFGSMTCPPFKGQLEAVDAVYAEFSDRAAFLFIYIREAHPDSVLSVVKSYQKEGLLKIAQASSLADRIETAAVCQRTMELKMPIAIDSMDNKTSRDYAGWPNRCVVIGTDGRVLYKAEVGPSSTNAQRLRSWLTANLAGSNSLVR
jgi:Iodothyronine deiodinase